MANIYHAAGYFYAYTNALMSTRALVYETNTSYRQTANSRTAMGFRADNYVGLSPVWSAGVTEFWFHCVYYSGSQNATAIAAPLTFINSLTGQPQFRIIRTAGTSTFQAQTYNGSTWSAVGGTFTILPSTRYRMDIQFKIDPVAGEINLWLDEVSQFSYSGAVATVDSRVDQIIINGQQNSGPGDVIVSELIVTDFDTRSCNVVDLYPTSNGANTSWIGVYTDIDDTALDENDMVTTDTINAVETVGVSNVPTGPDAQDLITLLLFVTGHVIPGGVVSDIQPVIRLGGTDHAGSSMGMDAGLATKVIRYDTDPSTGVGWGVTNLNAMEYGVKAV